MNKFILAYHGGRQPETPEEGAVQMAKWKDWASGLGDAIVDPGMPLGPSKMVSSAGVVDGSGENALTGITIVQASNIEEAIKMAQACPYLDIDGTLEVAEAMQMSQKEQEC